jgi:hypothetical protein
MTKLVDTIAIAITSGAKLAIAEMSATGTITERTNIPTNRAILTSATAMTRMQVRTLVAVRVLTTKDRNPVPAIRDQERQPDRDRDHDPRDVFTRSLSRTAPFLFTSDRNVPTLL